MGCDIHMYKEKQVNGQWLTADEWADRYGDGADVPWEKRFTDRNYNLFSILAGVRTREETGFEHEPRGLPVTVTPAVRAAHARCDSDAHSASYLYLHELKDLLAVLQSASIPVSGMKDGKELEELTTSIQSGNPNWDLLFPYCQGTNSPTYRKFRLDVPASFMVGDGLEKIIASFDGVEGDNHRVVFWFDN